MYIVKVNALMVLKLVKTYSHSGGCLFTGVTVSFAIEKCLVSKVTDSLKRPKFLCRKA